MSEISKVKVREIPVEQGGGWQLTEGGYVMLESDDAHEVKRLWIVTEIIKPKLMASLREIKKLFDGGDYGIARKDGEDISTGEAVMIGNVFERMEQAIKEAEDYEW